jgi:hypothetical protein
VPKSSIVCLRYVLLKAYDAFCAFFLSFANYQKRNIQSMIAKAECGTNESAPRALGLSLEVRGALDETHRAGWMLVMVGTDLPALSMIAALRPLPIERLLRLRLLINASGRCLA